MTFVKSDTMANLDHADAINQAHVELSQHHQNEIAQVNADMDNLGGAASPAYQAEIGRINAKFAEYHEHVANFGRTFGHCTDDWTMTDQRCAAQYDGGGGHGGGVRAV